MADNVPISAGSGTDVATDQVAGTLEHVQLFKLAIATDGSRVLVPADATDGLLVNLGANNDVTVSGTFWQATQPVSLAHAPTATQSSVADSASSVTILASNVARVGASVTNDSTATLYLRLSASAASTTDYTVQLVTGAYYEVPSRYSGAITGIWASDPNTGAARVTEVT
jgi:hypothetical protein